MPVRKRFTLLLTSKEFSLLCGILGFVEAGEISGGPLDAETSQQRSVNLRVFGRLCDKISQAGRR
jgi:hypothetical protein